MRITRKQFENAKTLNLKSPCYSAYAKDVKGYKVNCRTPAACSFCGLGALMRVLDVPVLDLSPEDMVRLEKLHDEVSPEAFWDELERVVEFADVNGGEVS